MFRIKYSRESTLKMLYLTDVLDVAEISSEQLLENNLCFFPGLNNREKNFILRVMDLTRKNKATIDKLIADNLIGWKLERLLAIDRCLLRMGLGEAYFNDQKPVIIDDVIRIAKKYGSEESYKIINAILDKVIE